MLAKIGPTLVNVSVVGNQVRHDSEFRRSGAFRDVCDGISTFLNHRDPKRSRVCINCTVTLENVGELEEVVKVGKALGVDHVRFTWLSFLTPSEMIPGDQPTCLKVTRSQLDAFDAPGMAAEIERLEKEYPGFITFQPDLSKTQRISWYREGGGVYRNCLPIWHTLFMRPDGQATACGHFLDEPLGQVLDRDLTEVWNHPRMRQLRLAEQRSAMCKRCCKI
jgi:MoaA/NifB/PqqE/SkfB family radical SAM enzyme